MLYLIHSFHSYFTIKCTTFGSKSLSILLFPIKQQQQQKLKKLQNKMQNNRAKFQNKIKSSTVVQLGQHYYGENRKLTQDHPIECSSEQLQLLVIQ